MGSFRLMRTSTAQAIGEVAHLVDREVPAVELADQVRSRIPKRSHLRRAAKVAAGHGGAGYTYIGQVLEAAARGRPAVSPDALTTLEVRLLARPPGQRLSLLIENDPRIADIAERTVAEARQR